MNITETVTYDKEGNIVSPKPWVRLFVPLIIILVGLLGFGIGRLTGGEESSAIKIEYDPALTAFLNGAEERGTQRASAIESLKPTLNPSSAANVIASKNGNKYHYSHCPGAKQIKEENKISFSSAAQAEASGYTLAANCKAP
jgi:hypothetical protein